VGNEAVGVADWPAVDGFAEAACGALSLRRSCAFVTAARPAEADRHATQIKAPLIQFSLMGVSFLRATFEKKFNQCKQMLGAYASVGRIGDGGAGLEQC
jgi:hypothetical protein